MIQSLHRLGEVVHQSLESKLEILQGMIDERPLEARGDYIGLIDIDPDERMIRFDRYELGNGDRLREFLYVNLKNARTRGDIVDASLDKLHYLLSEVVPNLAPDAFEAHFDFSLNRSTNGDLEATLDKLVPCFHQFRNINSKKYRFFLDLDQFKISPHAIDRHAARNDLEHLSIDEQTGQLSLDWPAFEANVVQSGERREVLSGELKALMGLGNDIEVFSLALQGEPIAKVPSYVEHYYEEIIGNEFKDASNGRCYLCAQEADVVEHLKRIKHFKLYITQKLNFASGLTKKGFDHNFGVCDSCYIDLLLGDRFLASHLETSMLATTTYLIPQLPSADFTDVEQLKQVAGDLKNRVTSLDRTNQLQALVSELAEIEPHMQLNLLLAQKSNQGVKVRQLIPEVPPSRMVEITRSMNQAQDQAASFWGEGDAFGSPWLHGLRTLFAVMPLATQSNSQSPVVGPALKLARQIFLGEPIRAKDQIRSFLAASRAIHHRNPAYHLTRECRRSGGRCPRLHDYIVRTLAWRAFLINLGLWIEKEEDVEVDRDVVPSTYHEVLDQFEFDTAQQALFLMGVLVGRIANAQAKGSRDRSEARKPILNKLGYRGMSEPRLRKFCVELFEKMHQYKQDIYKFADAEAIYGAAFELLNRERSQWPLTDQDNVYYVLAGYAHETRKAIRAGSESQSEEGVSHGAE